MRFYFYLTPLPDGRWALFSSLDAMPTLHPDKLSAMLDAKTKCLRHWEQTGTPCGVRVQARYGKWEDHHLVGGVSEEAGQP